MKRYFIGISRTWEDKTNGTFSQDTRDFEVFAESKIDAQRKAFEIASDHGAKWSLSYIEEL